MQVLANLVIGHVKLLKPLNQFKENLAAWVISWQNLVQQPRPPFKKVAATKIEMSVIVCDYCCSIICQNELKFQLQLHGIEQFNTSSVITCEFCFQPIYTDQACYEGGKKHIKIICVTTPIMRGAVVVMIIWQLDLQVPMQSVPITTNAVSLNPAHIEVYSIQHYVLKFVSDLWQVCGFLHQ